MKTEESNNLPSANTSGNHQGPGPHPGDEFADEAAFRAAVEVHTQIVNPGSSLEMRKMKNNRQIQCRNYHTGCRYEFYAALHPPAEDGTRRVIVTDVSPLACICMGITTDPIAFACLRKVTPDHHEMCIAELVLRGRRPAPDGEEPIRTRRSRASLAGLAGVAGQGSQSSQAGTSINGGTKVVARKSTQGQKQIPRSRLHDSDSDSDRPALRESNLLSHTSMSSLAPKITAAGGPARSARPPLIPPSQRVQGRPPLQPMDNAPSRPVKRTRFEDVVASSSSSSHGSMPSKPLPTHVASSTGDSGSAGPAANSYASARLVQVMQDHPQAANLLAELGYHTVADLVRIGVSVEDWPDLFQFLGGCSTESFRDEQNSRAGHLDPLERFLLHRKPFPIIHISLTSC